MADVAERAQVLLMAALTMAILFVALALILNTAIYTENLATRGSETAGGGDAIRFLDTAREGIAGSIEYVNRHNHTNHSALKHDLSDATSEWTNASGTQFANRGRAVDVSLLSTENGSRISLTSDREFTSATGSADWTLVENVSGTRDFRINISDAIPLESNGSGDEFEIVLRDGNDDTWRMNVTEAGADSFTINIQNGSNDEFSCGEFSATEVIDVNAGTVAGSHCDGLSFAEGIESPYGISFINGNNVSGTFTLVTDNVSLATSAVTHLDDAGPGPYVTPAIYSAELDLAYRTPNLYYNATVRVAPGEFDD